MKNYFLFAVILALNSIASAQIVLKSAKALTTEVKGQKFLATLVPGYHFNDKAPNQIKIGKKSLIPSLLEKNRIEFQLPTPNDNAINAGAEAYLYVCDDAITYCETHRIALNKMQDEQRAQQYQKPKNFGHVDKNGFIKNDFEKALLLAKEKNQPVFIDFWARWCPGCTRVENEIFNTAEFKKISKNFIKLKMDVDLFTNFATSQKYAVRTIPALIVISPAGDEIDRLLDYQPIERFQLFFTTIEQNPTPMKDLKDPLALGLRLYASGRNAESLEQFAKLSQEPPEALTAKVEAAQEQFKKDDKQKNTYAQTLRSVLKIENSSTRSLGWRRKLIDLLDPKSAEVANLVSETEALVDQLVKDPQKLNQATQYDLVGEFTGYEKLFVAIYLMDVLSAAKIDDARFVKAAELAVGLGKEYKIAPKNAGPALRYLLVLNKAKKFAEAESFANLMLKNNPQNIDIQRRKIRIFISLKRYKEAIQLGEMVLLKTEGRNEFWAAEALTEAYIAEKENQKAKELLTKYIARPELNTKEMNDSKTAFDKLLKSVE